MIRFINRVFPKKSQPKTEEQTLKRVPANLEEILKQLKVNKERENILSIYDLDVSIIEKKDKK